MSCFVISNLIVTAGMLTPGLQVSSSALGHCYMATVAVNSTRPQGHYFGKLQTSR